VVRLWGDRLCDTVAGRVRCGVLVWVLVALLALLALLAAG